MFCNSCNNGGWLWIIIILILLFSCGCGNGCGCDGGSCNNCGC